MNREGILRQAKTEEFWVKNVQEMASLNASSFFKGIQLREEKGNTCLTINLNAEDITTVVKLCNHSDVLLYNYFLNVITKLLFDYKEVPFFLSPVCQFQQFEESDKIFFIKPEINSDESFKQLFSSQKSILLQQVANALSWEDITSLIEDTNVLNNLSQFGFVVSTKEITTELKENVHVYFQLVLDAQNPYLKIELKGKMYAPRVLELFGENFNTLLSEVLTKTYEPLQNLQSSGSTEQQILKDINTPRTYFSLEKKTLEQIDEQAKLYGNKVAIQHNDETITYNELALKSNQLASYLVAEHKAQKDMLFGVMMPRSIRMVEAILGVWKAGSAYVPVGTDLPDENLLQIIENSQFKAIITDNETVVTQLTKLEVQVPIIHLKNDAATIATYSTTPLQISIEDNDLAYVIYTSGSTGKPKGVMIEHLGMLNHIGAKVTEMNIDKNSIVAQNAPHTFDISIWQLFAPLVVGATGVIYDNETIIDSKEFISKLEEDQITILELVPSYLLEMLYHMEAENANIKLALTILILNAETLTKSMVERWLTMYPKIPIVNTYGATEVSDDTSHYIMNEVPNSYSVPVMTYPIQNFEVHIVDENFRKVPIGVQGEILLAGPCVGRGYFNDPERTKKAYLQGPIEGVTNCEKVYKTGDLGRFMPDGTMEFIGRNDNQVKISGHRIELDAIENITAGIDGIKNAKAVAHTDKQFIALYYLADEAIEKAIIEETILQKLPKYMLPSVIIHMTNFPVTANGKINKKELPNPLQYLQSDTANYVAPETATQKKLVAIWEEILNVEKVGINDHFFELGGHSLKLMRLKNEYHKEFSVNIKIKEFFENPTLKVHALLIDNAENEAFEKIEKVPEASNYAVSDAQKRLWVLSQFDNGSVVYNMPFTTIFNEQLDVEKFKLAIQAVIQRHEILRTVFKEDQNGEIKQWILNAEAAKLSVNYLDYSEKSTEIEAFINEDSFKPFDLANGPLLRAFLFKKDAETYVFYYNMHHIIGDGWSTQVLVKDVMTYYEAMVQNVEPNLPELDIQYKDYATWQLKQLHKDAFLKNKDYWTQKITGELPVLQLPTSKDRPLVKTHNGRILGTHISKELTQKLRTYCAQKDGSLFMGLIVSVNTLLYKYSGQEDIILGTPIAGRNHQNLENQIGFYVNTLVLRNTIAPNEDFNALFDVVKQTTLEAYEHQQYPFDRLVDDLEIKRDTSRNPVFDVMVVLQNLENSTQSNTSRSSETIEQLQEFAPSKFDIEIVFQEEQEDISFFLNYNTDVYTEAMMCSFMKHYKSLLSKLIETPEKGLSQTRFLAEEEYTLLSEFNNTTVDYSKELPLLAQFSKIVENTPNATALVFEETSLTYEELDIKTNQLANFLLQKEFATETLIPICFERSLDMVIAIIAILKSGNAYVPIDPNYPKDRLDYILTDINTTIVLTSSVYNGLFDSIETVALDTFEFNEFKTTLIPINIQEEQLAYCIYTSGTTGKPKGVLNEHNGLLNRLLWMREDLNIDSKAVLLQKTPYTFDVSVWELLMPLISGCKLIILRPEGHKDPAYLQEVITAEKVTHIHFVPSMLNIFLKELTTETCKTLNYIICSGEALAAATVEKSKTLLPNTEIHNLYGPTEAAIDVTSINLTEVSTEKTGVSIGKPVANTQIYIVDEALNMQPIGVVGELLIGGIQVARGYVNKPALTAEKFISNPFETGKRLYKTGDLACWNQDGTISYLGRNDHQVKIRGNRIELGEIENQLVQHENIQEAVVLAVGEKENKQLVAYIIADTTLTTSELRIFLSQNVPDYMLPTSFVDVAEIPLTANGKVNRKALLALKQESLDSGVAYTAPRNDVENQLVALWCKILGKEANEIGIDIGFFEIGGNSLQIVKLRNEIQKTFNQKITVVTLFQNVTIRMQAAMLLGTENTEEESLEELTAVAKEHHDIAVIGMSVKVPGASNIDAFWKNLTEGVESIQRFTEEELRASGVSEATINAENYVPYGSFLEGKNTFDASFFGYLPDEAKLMDPQTRVFHEIVWSALENAGYDPNSYKGLIGLYAGAKTNIKWQAHSMLSNTGNLDDFAASYLSDKDFANSLIAYKLNLRGSVHTVNTACSTSLVAVHQAVQSILDGENHMAVAGGITIRSTNKEGYFHREGMINSKDGQNRTFDALASGTISGEGAGAIVLKRLDKAIQDNDNIIAVIKGSAINNDGNRKVGYTAPSIEGQVEVIKTAQKVANVTPASISYIEAHGTATKLGDPIEVEALNAVFGASEKKYCSLGTVKSNLGHLDAAAGIIGFIKTALCLRNKKLVPSLHFNTPNPEINFEAGSFYVNTTYKDWTSEASTLRAGVSSFGIGGTNAHIILEEAPQVSENVKNEENNIITIAAKTDSGLTKQKQNLKAFLTENKDVNLSEVAWTLQTRKPRFSNRLSFVAKTVEEAIHTLDDKGQFQKGTALKGNKKVAFMFTGQGSQYVNMGKDLYENEATFKETLDRCFEIATDINQINYKSILYPNQGEESELINQTKYTQPILFMFEYALAKQLEAYGISPDMMIGHSIGEYVAACISGVLSLENALQLVIQRGTLIQDVEKGAMLGIACDAETIKSYLLKDISIAAINTPNSCVVAGNDNAMDEFSKVLDEKKISYRKLHTSHAFHSSMMNPVSEPFEAFVSEVEINTPTIPYISNVTGKMVTLEELQKSSYWTDHIKNEVKFSEGLTQIIAENNVVFVEVGPGNTLSTFVRQHYTQSNDCKVSNTTRHPKETQNDHSYFLNSLGKLWTYGIEADWNKFHTGKNYRVQSLPTYPFEETQYPMGENVYRTLYDNLTIPAHEIRADFTKWFYEPTWKQEKLYATETATAEKETFLLFRKTDVISETLVAKLKNDGHAVIEVYAGTTFKRHSETVYEINIEHQEDYKTVFKQLHAENTTITHVIHGLTLETNSSVLYEEAFYSLLYITKQLAEQSIKLSTITSDVQQLTGLEKSDASTSLINGILTVICQEYPEIQTKTIDISLTENQQKTIQNLSKELTAETIHKNIIYRFQKRWVKSYTTIELTETTTTKVKKEGVYLITGGLGNLGYIYASHLIEKYDASVILIGRKKLVDVDETKTERFKELQTKGNVRYYDADISKINDFQKVILESEKELGTVNGVIHAAGLITGKSIRGINFLTKEACEEQFEAKVKGTNTLIEAFKNTPLDFCVLVSSLSSILGGKEFASYAAANSYLDYVSNTKAIENCISINFDGLNFSEDNDEKALNKTEIITVLEQVLAMQDISQVVISVSDLQSRIDQWVNQTADAHTSQKEAITLVQELSRENLSTVYVAPETKMESELTTLFEDFFGIKGIGIQDNFFDLGGDSLRAMTLSNHIHKQFNIELSLKDFFENPTIQKLSREIQLNSDINDLKTSGAQKTFDNEIII